MHNQDQGFSDGDDVIVPVLLGSDINVYGMARAFYEEYGVCSIALAEKQLDPTKYSSIVKVETNPGISTESGFIEVMRAKMREWEGRRGTFFLIACGDGYAGLVSRHKKELSQRFVCPYIEPDLVDRLEDKASFYATCDEHGLPHPKTLVLDGPVSTQVVEARFPLRFPVVLKPSDSIAYLAVDFEGYKKAYIIDSPGELESTLSKIYSSGYQGQMIVQDYVPGDDSHMRVLNAYVGKDGKVAMMSLGHPLLEDPSPISVGNYAAILPAYDRELYAQVETFLESIGYTGFANLDMKYDERDSTYKLFEINIRQGRSSYYVTLNGQNLARFLVQDYLGDEEPPGVIYANEDEASHKLWLGVPRDVFGRYTVHNRARARALQLLRSGKMGRTLWFKDDLSWRRRALLFKLDWFYRRNFRRYFRSKE